MTKPPQCYEEATIKKFSDICLNHYNSLFKQQFLYFSSELHKQ